MHRFGDYGLGVVIDTDLELRGIAKERTRRTKTERALNFKLITIGNLTLTTDSGSRSQFLGLPLDTQYEHVYLFPEGATSARLTCRIRRWDEYPRTLPECLIVADGIISSDGETIDQLHVIDRPWFSHLAWKPETDRDGRRQYVLEIHGEWSKSKHGAEALLDWGTHGNTVLAVFLDDNEMSAGVTSFEGSTASDGSLEQSRSQKAIFKGKLHAGQKIRIGITRKKADEIIHFDFTLPSPTTE